MGSLGIVEIISLLLSIAGFGLQPNPKPATADVALAYAIPDADLVIHFDVTSVVPSNYKLLTALPNQPTIKADPNLARDMREIVANIEGFRGMAKVMTGLDLATDISDATAFVQFTKTDDKPNVLVAVHGKITQTAIDSIGKAVHAPVTKSGGGAMTQLDAKSAVAVTKDNTLLVGTAQLVKDRLVDGWKSPSHAANTNLGHAADMISAHPVVGISATLSPTARQMIAASGKKNALTEIAARHKLAALSLYHDGIGWTWIDSSKQGLDAFAQMSDGMVDLLRAAQIAPRGFAKIAMGALEYYRGTNTQVDELLRHKDDLNKIMAAYTGDGQFKVDRKLDSTKLRLDVRATGKSASEVVPAGVIVPLAAIGFLVGRGTTTAPQPPTMQIPGPPPAAPSPPKPITPKK